MYFSTGKTTWPLVKSNIVLASTLTHNRWMLQYFIHAEVLWPYK